MTNRYLVKTTALLVGVSALAYGATASDLTVVPQPPDFPAQTKVQYVDGSAILEYKALPEYHEPSWVTKQFVDQKKLPPVKDRLPKEPMVYKTATCRMVWAFMAIRCVMSSVVVRKAGTIGPVRTRDGAVSISVSSSA